MKDPQSKALISDLLFITMICIVIYHVMKVVYNIWKNHYLKYKVQPSKFVTENKLLYPEGSVIKYVIRHQDKGGKEDLEKAKHMIDMIIERDYKWYLNLM